ncbi:carboxylesterase/lipase family protein [Microlunatus flavus]|uniref:Carboxylic ester hydrolase n=1 Tax=Microlunatus flavus TaxID=1036181 RepID=A0A1H9FVF0_9ACTN|nr:carboxylesterase family protein [Microlunatus flavus]SEQ41834.1 para-nitrobenzyl esterase [Microlunatus flavus]
MTRRPPNPRTWLAAAALPLVLAATALPTAPAAASTAPIVTTDHGAVRGAATDGVERFLGIPYAAAPTGARRWKAPEAPASWDGVREASTFGNACPVLPSTNGPRSETEDCLVVNVWRPVGTTSKDRLPVHVFIHGGGLVNGSGAQNDESPLVGRTGVIGVSLNYRLGVFGFLRTPGLAAEDANAGNYGFLDQEAALRWVQRNIAAFGGRASEVTIDGESAGGWSVCGHLVSRGSKGLFRRAMIQSGSCPSQTPARAGERGAAYVTTAGCAKPDPAAAVACLRSASVATVLDASTDFSPRFVSGTPAFPVAPAKAVAKGDFRHVPILVGANRDEGRTFAQDFIGASRSDYEDFVRSTFGSRADDVLRHYRWPSTSNTFTAAYLVGGIETDSGLIAGIGGCTNRTLTRTFAKYTKTYAYEFDHQRGPGLTPVPGYVWGAGHAAELAYIWPSFNNGTPIAPLFDASEQRLSREMTLSWGSFTRDGKPSVPDQPTWVRYRAKGHHHGRVMSLRAGGQSTLISDATYVAEHKCAFWATMPTLDVTA